MRKSLSATIMLLALGCPAFTGDMPTPPVALPIPLGFKTEEPGLSGKVTSPRW